MINRSVFWKCPNCSLPLQENKSGHSCGNGHSFDRAKQGYCNFLLPNQKNSRDPGDNMAMVDARRAFLDRGFYSPLVEKLKELVGLHARMEKERPLSVLDLGSGEGYYINQIDRYLAQEQHAHVKSYGIDISKIANRRAASRYKNVEFAVASTYAVPVVNDSVDVAISIFSPFGAPDIARILNAKTGILIRVSPGPRHLYQIKQHLYDTVNLHEAPMVCTGFRLVEQVDLHARIKLESQQDIQNLLTMTPLNWHGQMDAKDKLMLETTLDVEVEYFIQILALDKAASLSFD